MNIEEMKLYASDWASSSKRDFFEAAKRIWAHPELSMQEHESSAELQRLLRRHGFKVEACVGGMPTAFIAQYGSGSPVIGINCEYDALPGLSQDASRTEKHPLQEGGPGHGCGHNLLGAGGAFAAAILKSALEKYALPGTIKAIGAPAEELCLGKPFLAKAGLLSGYDAILDWHPSWLNMSNYVECPAYFSVKYHYTGKAAHGNSPWEGRSALDAAMLQGQATEFLREHIYPGNPPYAASTFNYTFSDAGPEFPSVVADRATIWYVGRFAEADQASEAMRRISNCAAGAALMTDTEVRAEILAATNNKIPNETLSECMHKNFQKIGPPVFTQDEQQKAREVQRALGVAQTGLPSGLEPLGGGFTPVTDITEYSWNAPFATACVALAPNNTGWHNWCVAYFAGNSIGLKSMETAAKLIALTGVDLLADPALVEKAKAEHISRLSGKSYVCRLPEGASPPVDLNRDIMKRYSSGAVSNRGQM
ncbi:MAG: amidohydrolase [Clostridiales bacterium]|jgi:aminobenzoyl-glutamate utilization protein B|nr:amidohydrolase [Clostridiales bacterium]